MTLLARIGERTTAKAKQATLLMNLWIWGVTEIFLSALREIKFTEFYCIIYTSVMMRTTWHPLKLGG